MKNGIIAIITLLFLCFTSTTYAQKAIDITTKGDQIKLKLTEDGKVYQKTYPSWKEVRRDKKVRQLLQDFGIETEDQLFSKAIEIDLSEDLSVKTGSFKLDFTDDIKVSLSIKTDEQ